MTEAERIKELEARVAELERRLSGGAGGVPPTAAAGNLTTAVQIIRWPDGVPMSGGRGGGGQG